MGSAHESCGPSPHLHVCVRLHQGAPVGSRMQHKAVNAQSMTQEEVFETRSRDLLVSVLWFGLHSDTHVLVFRCCFVIGPLGDQCFFFFVVLLLLHVCGSNQGCCFRVCVCVCACVLLLFSIDQHRHAQILFRKPPKKHSKKPCLHPN